MRNVTSRVALFVVSLVSFVLCSCASYNLPKNVASERQRPVYNASEFESRLPSHISEGQKVVLVDPRVHAWGAYGPDGNLIRGGMATAGADWCPDLGRPCHTGTGTFHINSLGSPECKSTLFPIGRGGAPMPYCMFFNRNQALHGTPDGEVVDGNISHGCVRMHVDDAEWLRYNFATVGTKVIVMPY